jgi:hypothetical protein
LDPAAGLVAALFARPEPGGVLGMVPPSPAASADAQPASGRLPDAGNDGPLAGEQPAAALPPLARPESELASLGGPLVAFAGNDLPEREPLGAFPPDRPDGRGE